MKDWYLRAWMDRLGRRQAEIIRDLGWERGRTSKVVNGKQGYTRSDVVQLSNWLGIEPFELLMSPSDALRLRHFQRAIHMVAEEDPPPFVDAPPVRRAG
jgi:plasmid maintenance system antidote protein VapI